MYFMYMYFVSIYIFSLSLSLFLSLSIYIYIETVIIQLFCIKIFLCSFIIHLIIYFLFIYLPERARCEYTLFHTPLCGIPSCVQKQSSRGVLRKRCSENMQQIYRRAPMPKCYLMKAASNFIKIAIRHGCSPVNLLHIFITPFCRTNCS